MVVYFKVWCHSWLGIFVCFTLTTFFFAIQHGQAGDFLDEPVETLDTIEVPGTALFQEERTISIPFPTITDLVPFPSEYMIPFQPRQHVKPQGDLGKVARDPIADVKGKRTPVRPAKAERPPYPHIAREQGWEGTVVLRIKVNREGSVEAITTRKSSGFPILDDSALQSVKKWTFEPAKDGEFAIPTTVDLPIRFDLDKP
jgi:TonB family protein